MVHKKYTYKSGKKFGPYYYETKRINGKVVTKYLGRNPPYKKHNPHDSIVSSLTEVVKGVEIRKENKRKVISLFAVFLFAVILFLFFSFQVDLTGDIVLDIKSNYKLNEEIEGNLKINIKEGELIPRDSRIVVTLGNLSKEIVLSNLVDNNVTLGEFFVDNIEITGFGEGYGLTGKIKSYPNVSFQLIIFEEGEDESEETSDSEEVVGDEGEIDEELTGEENETEEEIDIVNETEGEEDEKSFDEKIDEEKDDENIEDNEEVVDEEEKSEEEEIEEFSDDDSEDSIDEEEVNDEGEESIDDIGDSVITGEVTVVDSEFTVSGIVNKDEDFVYNLEEEQNAKLVAESVKVNGTEIDESSLKVEVKKDKVIVSTEYFEEIKGFGEKFLGDEELELNVKLGEFGFVADKDTILNVKLVYNDIVIVEADKDISVDDSKIEDSLNETEEGNETTEEKETEVINETIQEINRTVLNETEVGVKVNITQSSAFLNIPVKWIKEVNTSRPIRVIVEVPQSAKNITLEKIRGNVTELSNITYTSVLTGNVVLEQEKNYDIIIDMNGRVISGEVTADIELEREGKIIQWLRNLFRFTGLVIEEEIIEENASSFAQEILIEINNADGGTFNIEYETDPPLIANEEDVKSGKRVFVNSPEDVHYKNVILYTNLSEDLNIVDSRELHIYWEGSDSFIIPDVVFDIDNDSVYDYVQWTAPELSNQTFIIEITAAKHLDENRDFVSDIYREVRALDDNWSETIPQSHYVRVTFEKNLTLINDITVYPRTVNGTPKINVYEFNDTKIIAKFDGLTDNTYNRVILTDLEGEQDTFDLLILNGSVEFDHIIDPTVNLSISTGATNSNVTVQPFFSHITPKNTASPYDALVNYFSFDLNISNNTFYDYAERQDGIHLGNARYTSQGFFGGGLNVSADGSATDLVDVDPYPLPQTLPNGYTGMAWVKLHNYVASTITHTVWESGFSGFSLTINTFFSQDGRCAVRDNSGGGAQFTTSTKFVPAANVWYHVACVFNRTNSTAGTLYMYVNGAQNSSVAITTFDNIHNPPSVGYGIGCQNDDAGCGSNEVFNGTIDEFMLFNKSLAPGEISNIYNNQTSRFHGTGDQVFQNINVSSSNGNENRVNVTIDQGLYFSGANFTVQVGDVSGAGYSYGTISQVGINTNLPSDITITTPNNISVRVIYNAANLTNSFYTPLVVRNISVVSFTVSASNTAPNTPTPEINSTDLSNKTLQDLNCFDILSDDDGNSMNVTVQWFKGSVLNFSIDYNTSIANGTLFFAALDDANTTKNDIWYCGMRWNDGQASGNPANSSNLTIVNTLPTATASLPANGNVSNDRTPIFSWTSSDDDGDSLSYELNITCYSSSGGGCTGYGSDNQFIQTTATTYELTNDLKYLLDNNFYYNWSVRANDSASGYGTWTSDRNYSVSALVSISLPNSSIEFFELDFRQSNDTADNSPLPFLLQNDGNAFVNVTIQATNLWNTQSNPSAFYQFKIANYTNENSSFYWDETITTYTNMPASGSPSLCVADLNYTDRTDSSEIDINITVPTNEGSGVRTSTVTFTSSLAG